MTSASGERAALPGVRAHTGVAAAARRRRPGLSALRGSPRKPAPMAATDSAMSLELRAAVEKLGIAHALVVTDRRHASSDALRGLIGALPWSVSVTIYEETPEQISEAAAREAAELYTLQGCDGIIGVGPQPSIALACLVGVLASASDQQSAALQCWAGEAPTAGSTPPVIAVPDAADPAQVRNEMTVLLDDGRRVHLEGPQLAPTVIAAGAG